MRFLLFSSSSSSLNFLEPSVGGRSISQVRLMLESIRGLPM